jgi:hypothetical protein
MKSLCRNPKDKFYIAFNTGCVCSCRQFPLLAVFTFYYLCFTTRIRKSDLVYQSHSILGLFTLPPISVTVRSKAWTVFARSNAGIVGSNPTQGMDVYERLFCFCFVLCVGIGLATGWSPVQGILPSVYKIKKLKKRPRSNKGLYGRR